MPAVYNGVLILHNLLRWVALFLGVAAVVASLSGWLAHKPWTEASRRLGTFFAISMDIQLLLGLVLYFFLSPFTLSALRNFGQAMRDQQMRFFSVEHLLLMLSAVVFAHLGSALSKRGFTDHMKYRRAALWFGLALIAILLGIPWFRPLLRL